MTFDFWVAAEKWFEGYAGIILGGIVFVVFAMGFALTRRKTKAGKRFLAVGSVVVLILGGVLFFNNHRYKPYLERAYHVTPAIRHSEFKVFQGYQPLLRSQTDVYARLHDPEGVEATGLYEEEKVTQPVSYLGKSGRHYFFDYEGRIFKQYETSVTFDKTAEKTEMVGSLYHLKEKIYETIGFQNTPYIFYDHIVIAEENTGKEYHPEDEGLIPSTRKVFLEWTFKN